MRASEIQPRKLVIFDIDDTLVHTQTKVHVVKDGRVTKSLNSHDFTHYKLQPDEQFDFENFRNAHDFFHNSKPIIPMMNQLKSDIATGNKVVMVTARADFDDRELFLDTFRKYGVDMSRVHVYRAGNMSNKIQTEEKKKIIIRNLLNKGQYTKAIMYDDAEPNLESFVELKKEYPKTKFYAWHVSLEGEASEYQRTNEMSIAEGKEQFNYELAQKGFHFEQEINGVTYRVSNKKGGSDNINIEALDDKGQSIGFARFWMHQYKDGLESLSTQVRDDWQGKGIAANMYAVMRMLGVNIHPASTQSDDGKKMWDKWNKQGDAQHIKSMNAKMTEQGVAEGLSQNQGHVRQTLNAWMNRDQQYEDPSKRAGFQAKVWPYIQQNIKTILADKGEKGNGDYPAAPYAAWLLVQHMDAHPQNQIEFYNALKQAIPNHPKIQFLRDRAAVNQWIMKNANNPEYFIKGKALPNPTVNVRNPDRFKDAGIVATSREEALANAEQAGNKLLVAAVNATNAQTQPSYKQLANENFADGRNPQDKGDSKRHGINTKASVSSLRKTAKQGGRKGQLAHWLANMKAGRAKNK